MLIVTPRPTEEHKPRVISEVKKQNSSSLDYFQPSISGELLCLDSATQTWARRHCQIRGGVLLVNSALATGNSNNLVKRISLRNLNLRAGPALRTFALYNANSDLSIVTFQTTNQHEFDTWIKVIAIELLRQTPLDSVKYLDILGFAASSLTAKPNPTRLSSTLTRHRQIPNFTSSFTSNKPLRRRCQSELRLDVDDSSTTVTTCTTSSCSISSISTSSDDESRAQECHGCVKERVKKRLFEKSSHGSNSSSSSSSKVVGSSKERYKRRLFDELCDGFETILPDSSESKHVDYMKDSNHDSAFDEPDFGFNDDDAHARTSPSPSVLSSLDMTLTRRRCVTEGENNDVTRDEPVTSNRLVTSKLSPSSTIHNQLNLKQYSTVFLNERISSSLNNLANRRTKQSRVLTKLTEQIRAPSKLTEYYDVRGLMDERDIFQAKRVNLRDSPLGSPSSSKRTSPELIADCIRTTEDPFDATRVEIDAKSNDFAFERSIGESNKPRLLSEPSQLTPVLSNVKYSRVYHDREISPYNYKYQKYRESSGLISSKLTNRACLAVKSTDSSSSLSVLQANREIDVNGGYESNRTGCDSNRTGWETKRNGCETIQNGYERNQTGFECNQTGFERNQTGCDSNQTGFECNQTGFECNRVDSTPKNAVFGTVDFSERDSTRLESRNQLKAREKSAATKIASTQSGAFDDPLTNLEYLLTKCQSTDTYVPVRDKLKLFESLSKYNTRMARSSEDLAGYLPTSLGNAAHEPRAQSMHDLSFCNVGVREICKMFEPRYSNRASTGKNNNDDARREKCACKNVGLKRFALVEMDKMKSLALLTPAMKRRDITAYFDSPQINQFSSLTYDVKNKAWC